MLITILRGLYKPLEFRVNLFMKVILKIKTKNSMN